MLSYLDIQTILQDVNVPPYRIRLHCQQCVRNRVDGVACEDSVHSWYLRASLWRKNTYGEGMGWGYGGKYLLSPHMSEDELVRKALKAALDFAEHEVREAFEYKQKRVFGPHLTVAALVAIADQTTEREVQVDA